MSGNIYLQGSETVHDAASIMSSAADRMQSAASSMDDSLTRQRQWMDEWLDRFENILKEASHANDK